MVIKFQKSLGLPLSTDSNINLYLCSLFSETTDIIYFDKIIAIRIKRNIDQL